MNSKKRMALIACVTASLAAGGARAAYAQGPSDPCSPLTQPQVSAAVGVTVSQGEAITPHACQWRWTNHTTSTVRITLQFLDAQDLGDLKTSLPGIMKTPAPGLGDDAAYAKVGALTTLSVKKGNVGFVVRLYGVAGHAKQMAIEKTLALDVLPKL